MKIIVLMRADVLAVIILFIPLKHPIIVLLTL